MAARPLPGYQREVAERNVDAILESTEDLLRSQGHVNISAVAAQAGVSRVTVYAHFPTWQQLLEAAMERSVRPYEGPPVEALDRMLAGPGSTWRHIRRWPRRWRNPSAPRPSRAPTRPPTTRSARCWHAAGQMDPSGPTCPSYG